MTKTFDGWRILWLMTALLAGMSLFILTAIGWDTEGYRMVIRATARTSIALFLAAFAASALVTLWPNDLTRWLRRNRRYLGVSFAMSHAIHLAAIVTLARTDPATFWMLSNPGSIIAGSFGYLAITLLAATSFDGMVKALGPKAWQRLHMIGGWFIWVSFVFTNGKRIPVSAWYAVPVAILFAVLVLKLVAKARNRRSVTTGVADAAASVG